jgi:hypothetical protein
MIPPKNGIRIVRASALDQFTLGLSLLLARGPMYLSLLNPGFINFSVFSFTVFCIPYLSSYRIKFNTKSIPDPISIVYIERIFIS